MRFGKLNFRLLSPILILNLVVFIYFKPLAGFMYESVFKYVRIDQSDGLLLWKEVGLLVLIGVATYALFRMIGHKVANKENTYLLILLTISATSLYLVVRFANGHYACWGFQEFKAVSYLNWMAYADLIVLSVIPLGYYFIVSSMYEPGKIAKVPDKIEKFEWIADTPINDTEEDGLERKELAASIAHTISTRTANGNPFGIAITGEWGSGKTSFLKMIEQYLQTKAIVVWYKPWGYYNKEELTKLFYETIADALDELDGDFGRSLTKKTKLVFQNLPNWLAWTTHLGSNYETLEGLNTYINNKIKKSGKPLVIIIDDLDRLLGEEIIETLGIAKNCGNLLNTYVILSYDTLNVEKALKGKAEDAVNYLMKFSQVNISLGKVPLTLVHKSFLDWLKSLVEANELDEWFVEEVELAFNAADGLKMYKPVQLPLFGSLKTRRDSNNLRNNIEVFHKMLTDSVLLSDLIVLELIRFKHPEVYNLVKDREIVFVARQYMPGNNINQTVFYRFDNNKLTANPKYGGLSNSEKEAIKKTLECLFPEPEHKYYEVKKLNCLRNIYYFEQYFNYSGINSLDRKKLMDSREGERHGEFVEYMQALQVQTPTALKSFFSEFEQLEVVTVDQAMLTLKVYWTFADYTDRSRIINALYHLQKLLKESNDENLIMKQKRELTKYLTSRNDIKKPNEAFIGSLVSQASNDKTCLLKLHDVLKICAQRASSIFFLPGDEPINSFVFYHRFIKQCYFVAENAEINYKKESHMQEMLNELKSFVRIHPQLFLAFCIHPVGNQEESKKNNKSRFTYWIYVRDLFKDYNAFAGYLVDSTTILKGRAMSEKEKEIGLAIIENVQWFHMQYGKSLFESVDRDEDSNSTDFIEYEQASGFNTKLLDPWVFK